MEGNKVFGFMAFQSDGTPRGKILSTLRLLGFVVLVGAVLSLLQSTLGMVLGSDYLGADVNEGALAAGAVLSMVLTVAFTLLVCFWITFIGQAWTRGEPRARTHTLVLGILAIVFGGLGLLGGLAGLLFPEALVQADRSVLARVVDALALPVAAAELYCGIQLVANRSKAALP